MFLNKYDYVTIEIAVLLFHQRLSMQRIFRVILAAGILIIHDTLPLSSSNGVKVHVSPVTYPTVKPNHNPGPSPRH